MWKRSRRLGAVKIVTNNAPQLPLSQVCAFACAACILAQAAPPPESDLRPSAWDQGSPTQTETWSVAPMVGWVGIPGVSRYEVEMAGDDSFSEILLSDTTPVPRYVPSNGLPPGTFFWRARVAGAEEWLADGRLSVRRPERVIDVPDGADAAEIAALAAEAARLTPAVLRFPERGSFRIAAGNVLLDFRSVTGLVVDGRGSTITFTTPMSGFARMKDCREVSFRDFVINHDPPPFTVARILTVDHTTGELTLAMEPGHPALDAPHLVADWSFCMFLEPEGVGGIRDDSPLVPWLDKATLSRIPGGFRIRTTSPQTVEVVRPGDRVVQFARKDSAQSLVYAERSPDAVFLRIVNHSISAGHYLLMECDGARVLNCHSLPALGLSHGGNADGVHVRSPVVGPWIEGCSFEALGDDGVALYGKGIVVKAQPSAREVLLGSRFFNLAPGQRILFFDPRAGVPVGSPSKVVSITPGEGGVLVQIEPPLETPLVFDHEEEWNNDQAFNLSARHAGFVVRRNSFRNIRRYGIIARAENGAIEDNTFEGVSDSAIALQNEPTVWHNGLHSESVRITGNRIRDCNFSRHARGRGAIHVAVHAIADVRRGGGHKASPWPGHRDLLVAGNEISGWRGHAISIGNVDGIRVTGNLIRDELRSRGGDAPAAIVLSAVRDATCKDNRFENSSIP